MKTDKEIKQEIITRTKEKRIRREKNIVRAASVSLAMLLVSLVTVIGTRSHGIIPGDSGVYYAALISSYDGSNVLVGILVLAIIAAVVILAVYGRRFVRDMK